MSLEIILQKLEKLEKFVEEHRQNGDSFPLGNHQLVPIYDAIENGLKRFVLAYGTGAGKTAVPLEIIKHLIRKGKTPKILVVAPNQTLLENWDTDKLEEHGLSMNVHHIKDKRDKQIPSSANFVTVNYEKLAPSLRYIEHLVNYTSEADLIVFDEFQNIKNKDAKTSLGSQRIIDSSKNARLIGLSATPIYDRMRDAGIMLYMLDPVRFAHYKDITFKVNEDPESLWEMREKGMIRFFDREAVTRFHNLPIFTDCKPIEVEMPPEHIDRYFEAFKNSFHLGKLHNLERIAIEAMIHSDDTKEFLRGKIKQGYTLNFFSHLIHEPRTGSPDEAIFRQLEVMLKGLGAKNIATIRGATSDNQRREIQIAMNSGNLDVLINQWDCTSEGFAEYAGNRPVCIIPLRSTYEPGRHIQLIGRSYRPGQLAPVEYQELHAHSQELLDRIENFVYEYALENNIRIKTAWVPSLFHRDTYMIRTGKEKTIDLLFAQRSHEVFYKSEMDISSSMQYARLLSKERILDTRNRNKGDFGGGSRAVISFVGKNYEEGLRQGGERLYEDYDRDNILLFTPGKINLFLAEAIERIKERERAKSESWKLADLGCCSSAVFTQSRLFYQILQSLRNDISLDQIVSVDGEAGALRTAKARLLESDWIRELSKINIQGFSEEDLLKAKEILQKKLYRDNLEFKLANFTKDDFGSNYDVVITSQCLQYNDQTNSRDIEKIVRNINSSLKEGGHYLSVLTGNKKPPLSFTTERDIECFTHILQDYGFQILKYANITGKKGKKEVIDPFHYFHAVKLRNANELLFVEKIPVMYSRTKIYLTGGSKDLRFGKQLAKKEITKYDAPDRYIDGYGNDFVL